MISNAEPKARAPSFIVAASAAAGVALTACGAAPLRADFVPPASIQRPAAADYPEADAVYVMRKVQGQILRMTEGPDRSQWKYHSVIAVLTEKGRDGASVAVPFHEDAKIIGFAARTIGPDGTITPVSRDQIQDDVGRNSDDTGYKQRTFAFPKVEVGSITEMSLIYEVPWVTSSEIRFVSSRLPTLKYEVEIEGNTDVYYRVRSYNVPEGRPWKVENAGPGWRLNWGMTDIPARNTEDYNGPAKAHEPFWVFGVQALGGAGRQVYPVTDTWDSTYRWRGETLYSEQDEYFENTDVKLDVAGCADARCKVERALEWSREKIPFRGFQGYPGRKGRDVLAQAEASGAEKARFIQKLLADVGVQARFAFYHPYLSGRVDPEFPEWRSMRRLLLYLPKQDGFAEPVWVDPACEVCGLGQLPAWVRGVEALLVDYEFKGIDSRATFTTRFVDVDGDPAPPRSWRGHYDVVVEADGRIQVDTTITRKGFRAQTARRWIRKRDDKEWKETAEDFAKPRIPAAQVTAQSPYTLDESSWTAVRKLSFSAPSFAVPDGDALVLPLSFMHSGFEDRLKDDERMRPLYFANPVDDTESVTIRVPAGYVVKSLPKSSTKAGPLEVRISVEQDGDAVRVERRIRIKPGKHDPERYAEAQAALEILRSIKGQAITFVREKRD